MARMTGKQLVKALKDSGTGEAKLEVARAALHKNIRCPADDVIELLEAASDSNALNDPAKRKVLRRFDLDLDESGKPAIFCVIPAATLNKAKQIARDGVYKPPVKEKKQAIEDLPDEKEPAPKP